MRFDVVLVDIVGSLIILFIVCYFWLAWSRSVTAGSHGHTQGALIVVKGGYTPDTIILKRGRPARLVFRREESAPCSERVVLPAFNKSALLPQGEEVPIEFVPTERGEYPFTCHMGILHGRIIVE